MKYFIMILSLVVTPMTFAADTINFSFNNEEITKLIETYSKASGQKFVVDPSVRGKATILLPEKVTTEEAFNQLSNALAINGYAISKQDDTMVIMSARNVQRNSIEVTENVPSLKPQRMVTWVYTPKTVSADKLNRDLRIVLSKDGEMSILSEKNQIIVTDWTSNIARVAELFARIDKPVEGRGLKK